MADPTSGAVADPRAVVRGDTWRVTVLTEGLLRLEHAPDGVFEDRPSTFARNRRLPVPQYRVSDDGGYLEITTPRLRLTYDRGPFSTSGLAVEVLGGITSYHSVWRFGEPDASLGGTARTLDEADGAIALEPGIVSRLGYGVVDDSRSFVFTPPDQAPGPDGGPDRFGGWVAPRSGARQDLYVFAYGHDHLAALRAFYAVSGPQPLLPRWALGNWWSRYYPYTADGYLALMDRFAAERVPLSVAVLDMDWHLVDVDPAHGSGWTGYTWNRALFPDPPAFLEALHDKGLRVTLNVHPADGVRAFEDAYPAMCAALGRDPSIGDPIAFDVTDPQFLRAYFDVLHRGLEDQGVDFWWVDWQSGPHSRVAGIDPLWMLNHFHYQDSRRDGRRGLTFSRYAGPGSHRYPVGFSGDTVISWESLRFQPEFTAAAANIGYGWWSHDIGGHMFGVKDDELATRWVQLGVFSPILRLHTTANPFATKEPWTFGPQAQAVQTQFLRLRHRLLPYLHSMNHRAATEGVPIALPLYYSWPTEPAAYTHPTQFTFGSELLVAPITAPSDPGTRTASVTAWLPPGTWVDVLGGLVYDGGREIVLHRDLTSLPVLARPGAVLPLDADPAPGNGCPHPQVLEVRVVPGADGAFELVEDDGAGDGGPGTRVARTPITWDQAAGLLTVGPVTGDVSVVPRERTWILSLVGGGGDPSGRVNHTSGPVPVDELVRLGPGEPVAPGTNDVAGRLFRLLDAAHVEYEVKTQVHRIATSGRPLHVRVSHLQALRLHPPLLEAVLEILLAR